MKKFQRILAMAGVVFLAGLYIVTLISALFSTPHSAGLFKASLFSTVFIPIMIYAILLIYKILKK